VRVPAPLERPLAIAWKDLLVLNKAASSWKGAVSAAVLLAPLIALAALSVYAPGPWRYAGHVAALATGAFFSALAFLVAVLPAATALALERDRDTLQGLVVSPATPRDLVLGKLAAALGSALAAKAVALPAFAIVYALGGIEAGFIPRYLAVLASADVSFASFALYASARPLRGSRLGTQGLARIGISQAQLAVQRSVGAVVLLSLVPIYATLFAVPLALQRGVALGHVLDTFASLGALHPLFALIAWGDARVFGVAVPVWLLAVSFHLVLSFPFLAGAAEAQRAPFAPRGRAARAGFALLFLFVTAVSTGAAWEAPAAVRPLIGTTIAAALLVVGAAAFAQAPPPRLSFGLREVLGAFLDPRRALESSAETAPGYAFLVALLALPFFFLVAPPGAAARSGLGLALAAIGIASVGARLAARAQTKESQALARALGAAASGEPSAQEHAEREDAIPEPSRAASTAIAAAALFVIASPLVSFVGLELVHRLHQLESLVPVLQGLGVLGLVTNPFTALEPLTGEFSGLLRQASLSFAGLEPGTISALHVAFWALVTLVALGTLGGRRAPRDGAPLGARNARR
jgi:hypothetical protein